MAYFHGCVESSEVGHDGYAEGLDAAMVGHDDFGHGAHAHGVASHEPVHAVFGGGLEGGALHAEIYAVLEVDAFLACYLVGELDEAVVVRFVHVGESWACGQVLASQGVLWEAVDVVGDDHEVADVEVGVHASGSVADEESLDAQLVHHAYGECDFLHGVAFVVVESSLHGHDVLASEASEDESAAMAFDCADGEVGDVGVGEFVAVSYF